MLTLEILHYEQPSIILTIEGEEFENTVNMNIIKGATEIFELLGSDKIKVYSVFDNPYFIK